MTGTVDDLIAAARATIGTKETGSNRQPFAAEVGHANGHPWCHTWAVAMAKRARVGIPPGVMQTAYTPRAVNEWKDAGRWFTTPEPGDFAYFQFDGDPQVDHVEIVEGVLDNGDVRTIGGNTSSSLIGSQSNGGQVAERVRPRRLIVGFGRPFFTPSEDDVSPEDIEKVAQRVKALLMADDALGPVRHHIAGSADQGARLPRALRDLAAVKEAHGID